MKHNGDDGILRDILVCFVTHTVEPECTFPKRSVVQINKVCKSRVAKQSFADSEVMSLAEHVLDYNERGVYSVKHSSPSTMTCNPDESEAKLPAPWKTKEDMWSIVDK